MRKFVSTLALFIAPTLVAQGRIAPPSLGPVVSYQYWPTQYIQFVTGPELPYTMFELDVDSGGKQPAYHAAFTGKDGARTHYSSTDALALYYKASGEASYKVEFAVESDETEKVGATMTARFTADDEKPVEFRFVQGSDISEQGSGLQPLPEIPVPVFAYRELGAVAGEGTALKVGNAVSIAEVWKEISHPPYFVGYRGAVTQSAHLIVLPRLTETWTVTAYPASVAAGSAWQMTSDRGDALTLKIDKAEGAKYTFSFTDKFHPANRMALEAMRNGEAWATTRVVYMPAVKGGDKHAATLTFAPNWGAAAGTMEIGVGKKTKLVTATTVQSGEAADRMTEIKFTAPAWAATKAVTEEMKVSGDTVVVSAK